MRVGKSRKVQAAARKGDQNHHNIVHWHRDDCYRDDNTCRYRQKTENKRKEKIKSLKKNVDVLTLSATPIPRTLHMSLTGVRDISVIETPPEERYPIQTYVVEQNDQLVRDAILREIISNSLAHRDYSSGYVAKIVIEKD